MSRFEILVDIAGVRHQLDTYENETISLTFNIADIADISARNTSFSKTIKLPETRKHFEYLEKSIFYLNKRELPQIMLDMYKQYEKETGKRYTKFRIYLSPYIEYDTIKLSFGSVFKYEKNMICFILSKEKFNGIIREQKLKYLGI